MITYEAQLHMHGTARLLNPVMRLAFEKMAGETEKQMAAVLNSLDQRDGASR